MTSRARIGEQLARAWIFESCSKRELSRIVSLGETRTAPAGTVLMERGDRARECFFVIEGRVRIELPGLAPKEVGAGSCIGEMALVDGAARSATATTLEDSDLLVVRRDRFRELLTVAPSVSLKLIEVLGLRLRTLERAMAQHVPAAAAPDDRLLAT